jgi:hypothetical protein
MTISKRRWFRWSLRTMFVVVTVLGVWLGWNFHYVRERDKMAAWIAAEGGSVIKGPASRPWKALPRSWSFLGAESVSQVVLGGSDRYTVDDLRRAESLFPEAEILHGDLRK